MDKIKALFQRIIQSKGKYFVVLFLFILWMLFFDSNRVSNQLRLNKKTEQLEKDIETYENKIKKAKADKIDLEVNKEKFAREKYYLHSPDEDVFIIDDSNNSKKEDK